MSLLPISHHQQDQQADCLAACAAMVLSYLQVSASPSKRCPNLTGFPRIIEQIPRFRTLSLRNLRQLKSGVARVVRHTTN